MVKAYDDQRVRVSADNMLLYVLATCCLLASLTHAETHTRRRQIWNTVPNETTTINIPQPRFRESPERVTFKEGQMAKLECFVEDMGTRKVIWRKMTDPNPLTIGRNTFVVDGRINVEHTPMEANWHLIIKQVRLDDAGEYECQISSVDRNLRKPVHLTVKLDFDSTAGGRKSKLKPAVIKISGKTYVEKGHKLKLICNATGEGADEIDWFRNGQKLATDDDKKVTIQKRVNLMERNIESILEVQEADMNDAGIYVCRTSDLLIDSTRIDVLNGTHFSDTSNKKREKDASSGNDGSPKSRQESLNDSTGNSAVSLHSYQLPVICVLCLLHMCVFHNFRLPT
ncbi:hemicentin-2-like isoform X3 [Physella acuta]|uniref:hemicentin-2-like isoform X3 n=1 Tax=Physella acuta TaxID=109671 RepID=UPI0027DE554E|nr:hemicentin-2-like isoform X3 [Physella acuta]